MAPAASAQGISPLVWSANSFKFDSGQALSVAVSRDFAIEVHEDGSGTLWFSIGQIQDSAIVWAESTKYAGYAPSIAINGNTVIEVHQAGKTEGPLWNVNGQITPTPGITWGNATQYDSGSAPSVAAAGPTVSKRIREAAESVRCGITLATSCRALSSGPTPQRSMTRG
jgi:hypothetical protein